MVVCHYQVIVLMARVLLGLSVVVFISAACRADEPTEDLQAALLKPIVADQQALKDVQRFTASRIRRTPDSMSLKEWNEYAEATRSAALEGVVFRGGAVEWRRAWTKVERLDSIDAGPGYQIQKLRIEVLPDLWIPALLYMPENLTGNVPVFLNVNGHDRAGKAADYKQARCIHMARNGVIALNLEWFGMGQLATPGFAHGRMNQIDLCGTSGLAPVLSRDVASY